MKAIFCAKVRHSLPNFLKHILRASALVLFLAQGCGKSREEALKDFDVVLEDASACGPSDTCVLAGASQCTCPSPVNAQAKSDVDAAAEEMEKSCDGAMVDCFHPVNIRCEQGRCAADIGP